MKYRYQPAAKDELFEAADFYESRQEGLGEQFRVAVENALNRVLADPGSFPVAFGKTRSITLKRFPFQLIFLVANDIVEIYAVAHHSRHPAYWTDRLSGNEG
jgi:hypothetical protein